MTKAQDLEASGTKFAQILDAAAKLPGVKIDRAGYLRGALKRHCTDEQIANAIADGPSAAGISLDVMTRAANTSIRYETSKATGLSTLAGVPGGLAMIGTVPADLAQYTGHMLRISQKLAYIYSWPDLFVANSDELDEATESMLILFIGVMFGANLAQGGVSKVAGLIAEQVAKKLPQQALTKGAVYPIVKRVASYLGVRMTTQIFANGVAKIVPVIGAAVSGGLTLGTFFPMSKRLQRHLASLDLTKPGHRLEEIEDATEAAPDSVENDGAPTVSDASE